MDFFFTAVCNNKHLITVRAFPSVLVHVFFVSECRMKTRISFMFSWKINLIKAYTGECTGNAFSLFFLIMGCVTVSKGIH